MLKRLLVGLMVAALLPSIAVAIDARRWVSLPENITSAALAANAFLIATASAPNVEGRAMIVTFWKYGKGDAGIVIRCVDVVTPQNETLGSSCVAAITEEQARQFTTK